MAKIPEQHQFYDMSDYARPFGDWLANRLKDTSVTPIHVSLLFIFVGFVAAYLYWLNTRFAIQVAGILLLLKSGLDAADGSLARVKNRPSQVGRFLDAIGDFVVNGALIFAIGSQIDLPLIPRSILALMVFLSVTWQVSVYNYFYVVYRWQYRGDTTSKTDESKLDSEQYPWDNQSVLVVLHRLYVIIYAWQDRLIAWLDRKIAGKDPHPPDKRFMKAASILGLGSLLLVIALFSWINKVSWSFGWILVPFNLYWMFLFGLRWIQQRR